MKVTLALFFCICLTIVSAANIRNKRQSSPRLNFDACFDLWMRETRKKMENIEQAGRNLMQEVSNMGRREDAMDKMGEELMKYYESVNNADVELSSEECDRQLEENWTNIEKSAQEVLNAYILADSQSRSAAIEPFLQFIQFLQQMVNNFFGSNRG